MFTVAKSQAILNLVGAGYVAGSGDGIVTVQGKPASRKIWLLNAKTLITESSQWSLENGRYLFLGLDTEKEYLVIVRDYKKEFEPFAWDYVNPATDLTLDQQQVLWQTWQ